jgi:hypothetical protein
MHGKNNIKHYFSSTFNNLLINIRKTLLERLNYAVMRLQLPHKMGSSWMATQLSEFQRFFSTDLVDH